MQGWASAISAARDWVDTATRRDAQGGPEELTKEEEQWAADFRRLWEMFRSSHSEGERMTALVMALRLFCKLLDDKNHVAEIVHYLVDVRPFQFVVARLFCEEINTRRRARGAKGFFPRKEIIELLSYDDQEDVKLSGAVLFRSLEHLVSPPLEVQGLLDAGLLSMLVSIFTEFCVPDDDSGSFNGADEDEGDDLPLDPRGTEVEDRVIALMKGLAVHSGAAVSLIEDDSLKKMFRAAAGLFSPSFSYMGDYSGAAAGAAAANLELDPKLRNAAAEILELSLASDTGGVARYIHNHNLLEVLLKAVIQYEVDSGDPHHVLLLVHALIECLRLAFRPDAGPVKLKEDFRSLRGYFWLGQLVLKLTFAADTPADPTPVTQLHNSPSPLLQQPPLAPAPSPITPLPGSGPDPDDATGGESKAEGEEKGEKGEGEDSGEGTGGSSPEEAVKSAEPVVPSALVKLLDALVSMAQTVGGDPPRAHTTGSRPFFRSPSGRQKDLSCLPGAQVKSLESLRVRDPDAVLVLQNVFLETNQLPVQLLVLERLQNLYAFFPENYSVIQELKTFQLLIRNIGQYPRMLQEQLLKVLEYTVIVLNIVPEQELLALCIELQKPVPTSLSRSALIFFNKLLSFEQNFVEVLRDVGLVDILVSDLRKCSPPESTPVLVDGSVPSVFFNPQSPSAATLAAAAQGAAGGSDSPSSSTSSRSFPQSPSSTTSSTSSHLSLSASGEPGDYPHSHPHPHNQPPMSRVMKSRMDAMRASLGRRLSSDSLGGMGLGGGMSGAHSYFFDEESTCQAAWECVLALMAHSPANQKVLRQKRGLQTVLPLLASSRHRPFALRLLTILISEDLAQTNPDEVAGLVQVARRGVAGSPGGRMWRLDIAARTEVLWTLSHVLSANPVVQETFLKVDGFSLGLAVIASIKGSATLDPTSKPVAPATATSGASAGAGAPLAAAAAAAAGKPPVRSSSGAAVAASGGSGAASAAVTGSALSLGGVGKASPVTGRYQMMMSKAAQLADLGETPLALKFEFVDALLSVLLRAVKANPAGRLALRRVIKPEDFSQQLPHTGLLAPPYDVRLIRSLLDLATETLRSTSLPQVLVPSSPSPTPVKGSYAAQHLGLDDRGSDSEGGGSAGRLGVGGGSPSGPCEWVVDEVGGVQDREGVTVHNAVVVQMLLDSLHLLANPTAERLLAAVLVLAKLSPRNAEALSSIHVVQVLLELFIHKSHTLAEATIDTILQTVEIVGTFRISPTELRLMALRLRQAADAPHDPMGLRFLRMLCRMAAASSGSAQSVAVSSFADLSMRRVGYAGAHAIIGERPWPPAGGFSFACWIRFAGLRSDAEDEESDEECEVRERLSFGSQRGGSDSGRLGRARRLQVFSVAPAGEPHECCAEMFIEEDGVLTLAANTHSGAGGAGGAGGSVTASASGGSSSNGGGSGSSSTSSKVRFSNVQLKEGTWHFITVVFRQPSALSGFFHVDSASLYVDGLLQQTGKLSFAPSPQGKLLRVTLGTGSEAACVSPLTWQLGPTVLFEEAVPSSAVLFMYLLGRGYRGVFQDPAIRQFLPLEACCARNLLLVEKIEAEAAAQGGTPTGLWVKGDDSSIFHDMAAAAARGGEGELCPVVWDAEKPTAAAAAVACRKIIFKFDGSTVELEENGELCPASLARTMVNLVDLSHGAASSLGGPKMAALFGDIQLCCPSSVADGLRVIGGMSVLLALLDMADTAERLHLALSLLTSCLRENPRNQEEMRRLRGHHMLAIFLHQRMPLVTPASFALLLSLAAPATHKPSSLLLAGDASGNSLGATSLGSPTAAVSAEEASELVLCSPGLVLHVLLDWTIWSIAPLQLQHELLDFLNLVVAHSRFRRHNVALLRRLDVVHRLLLALQHTELDPAVIHKLVRVLGGVLGAGFLPAETKQVSDFVLMTFKGSGNGGAAAGAAGLSAGGVAVAAGAAVAGGAGEISFGRSSSTGCAAPSTSGSAAAAGTIASQEPYGRHVATRNALLEMLIQLQMRLALTPSDERLDLWQRTVSSKVTTLLLDPYLHESSLKRVLILLADSLRSPTQFATRFRQAGGFFSLSRVLASYHGEPDIFLVLFTALFGADPKPSLCDREDVRLVDLHALLPLKASPGEDLMFPELLDSVLAMLRAALLSAVPDQSTDRKVPGAASAIGYTGEGGPEGDGGGAGAGQSGDWSGGGRQALVEPLRRGAEGASALVVGVLRFWLHGVHCPGPTALAAATRRPECLEGLLDLFFACMRHCAESARKATARPPSPRSSSHAPPRKASRTSSLEAIASGGDHEGDGDDGQEGTQWKEGQEEDEEEEEEGEEVAENWGGYGMEGNGKAARVRLSGSADAAMGTASRPAITASGSASALLGHPGAQTGQSGSPSYNSPLARHLSVTAASMMTWLGGTRESMEEIASSTLSSLGQTGSGKLDGEMIGGGEEGADGLAPLVPEALFLVDAESMKGNVAAVAAGLVLDIIGEVVAGALLEVAKSAPLLDAVQDAVPGDIPADVAAVFTGQWLQRVLLVLERCLLASSAEASKLDRARWGPNLEALAPVLADAAFCGSFARPKSCKQVLQFMLQLLQAANTNGLIENAQPATRGLLIRTRGTFLEPYILALLKACGRLVLYSFLPLDMVGVRAVTSGEDGDEITGCVRTSLTYAAEPWVGERRLVPALDPSLDRSDSLHLLLANHGIVLSSVSVDLDLVACLCHNLTYMILQLPSTQQQQQQGGGGGQERDSLIQQQQQHVALAAEAWKVLVAHRAKELEDMLTFRTPRGDVVDLFHGGFDTVLQNGEASLVHWLVGSQALVVEVLGQKATPSWRDAVLAAARAADARVKVLEVRRRKEAQRRARDSLRSLARYEEQQVGNVSTAEKVRFGIAKELLVRRQDKFGWVLQAEREWQGHLQQLVHERGIWPAWRGGLDAKQKSKWGDEGGEKEGDGGEEAEGEEEKAGTLQWQLCSTEGPFRMRKKMRRSKVQVDLRQKQCVTCIEPEPIPIVEGAEEEAREAERRSRESSKAESSKQKAEEDVDDSQGKDGAEGREGEAKGEADAAGGGAESKEGGGEESYLQLSVSDGTPPRIYRAHSTMVDLDDEGGSLADLVASHMEALEEEEVEGQASDSAEKEAENAKRGGGASDAAKVDAAKPERVSGSVSGTASAGASSTVGGRGIEASSSGGSSSADPASRGSSKRMGYDLGVDCLRGGAGGGAENDDGEYLIRPHLEPGERIRFRYNCDRVVGLDKRDGIFLIGDQCLYVIDNYFIDSTGRFREKEAEGTVSVLDQALGMKPGKPTGFTAAACGANPMKRHGVGLVGGWAETVAAWRATGGGGGENSGEFAGEGGEVEEEEAAEEAVLSHECKKWKHEEVHEVLKRRYQLRPVAIELFSMSGNNELLVFHLNERDECFKNLQAMNLPKNSLLDSTITNATESAEPPRLFKMMAKSLGKRWQAGEISNFHYLMHLNTLAGRGYNDLTQYPVFPWVLADYLSQELDLSDPSSFRPLNKPMGCITMEREEEFVRRYNTWDDPDIPRFHYGSHYSSAGTVLYYLMRLPPFSRQNMQLQGGHFDHADRMFYSIQETWKSASTGHTADVKELTPEFYYVPTFLENRFNLDLGVKQSGEGVDNVILPPWANGSPEEFIRKHREALESPYVSEHLNEWIDLIFGYKQQGPASVEAVNVFFYLTYEGSVNIDAITDPSTKASILAQINNFGQTPRQLFLKPHPKRETHQRPPLVNCLRYHDLVQMEESRNVRQMVTQILMVKDKVGVLVGNSLIKGTSNDRRLLWGFPDGSLRVVSTDQDKLLATHEALHDNGPIQCAAVSRDGTFIATGGSDGVVAIWRSLGDGPPGRAPLPQSQSQPGQAQQQQAQPQRQLQLLRRLCAHTQAVTSLAMSQAWGLVVTGSSDHTVIIWDLNSLDFVRQLPVMPAPVSVVYVSDSTGDVVVGAGTLLSVWTLNGDCLAKVNTSHSMLEAITCVTTPSHSDWMDTGWFLTGHRNGSIKMWCMDWCVPANVSVKRTEHETVTSSNSSGGNSAGGAASAVSQQQASSEGKEQQEQGDKEEGAKQAEGDTAAATTQQNQLAIVPARQQQADLRLRKKLLTPGTFIPRVDPEWKLVLCRELVWHKEAVTALFLTPELRQLFSGDIAGHIACWAIPDADAENIVLHDTQVSVCAGACRRRFTVGERRFECVTCKKVVCGRCGGSKMMVDRSGHYAQRWVCSSCQHQSDAAAAAAAAVAAAADAGAGGAGVGGGAAAAAGGGMGVRSSMVRGMSVAAPQGMGAMGGPGGGGHAGAGEGGGLGHAHGGERVGPGAGPGQRPFVAMPRISKQTGGLPQGGVRRGPGSMPRSTTSS
ncbi:hypothetical protein CLOM_g4532 [Closterium sp. NIES-68]|nr:hypothetical protein CLOM_g4532 [Closterium sp. NIES-68]